MKKIRIRKPVDAFRLFQDARTTMNVPHEDPYFRFVIASKLIESSTLIIDQGYGLALKNVLTNDPTLLKTLDVMTEIKNYAARFSKTIESARAAIKSVSDEKNHEARAALKKKITLVLRNERTVQMIIGKVQILASQSQTIFAEGLLHELTTKHSDSLLLQSLETVAA